MAIPQSVSYICDHVRVTKTNKVMCFHCGKFVPLHEPVKIPELRTMGHGFSWLHRDCLPKKAA